ncbi:hypothetical protein PX699_15760 [Sphingobium sp. H39-3-25]|uniref:hypothetical protein n=1 Tax=Sphingobium arseniciresistens TaxID=3030834 RepID=UPI0023B9A611|nr:hypothetical protein [Sphingobium arseniciresistens]
MDERVKSALDLMGQALVLLDEAQAYDFAAELQRLVDRIRGSGGVVDAVTQPG